MEFSMLWETQNGLGDGAFSYNQDQSQEYFRDFSYVNQTVAGVLYGVDNQLEVSGIVSPLSVDTGKAFCHVRYWNDAVENVSVPTPAANSAGRIVLRTDWSTNTCRLGYLINLGSATLPALTQTIGVTWEISLASFYIDTTGNIWTDSSMTTAGVTDERYYAIAPTAGMIKLREKTYTSGAFTFSNIQPDLSHLRMIINSTGGGAGSIYLTMLLNGLVANYNSLVNYQDSAPTNTVTGYLAQALFPRVGFIEITGAAVVNSSTVIIDFPFYSLTGAAANYLTFNSISTLPSGGAYSRLIASGSVINPSNTPLDSITLNVTAPSTFDPSFRATLYGIK